MKLDKICTIGYYPPPYGGISVMLKQCSEIWSKYGIKHYIFTSPHQNTPDFLKKKNLYVYRFNIKKEFSQFFKELKFFLSNKIFKKIFSIFGLINKYIYFRDLKILENSNLINIIYWIIKISNIIRKENIKIIHTHHLDIKSLYGKYISKMNDIPWILSVYGEIYKNIQIDKDKKWNKLMKFLIKDADFIIAVFNPSIDKSKIREKFNLENKKIILFFGHIHPRKGPIEIIKAMPKILKEVPNAYLILAGPDYWNYFDVLIKKIKELKIEKHVKYVGKLDFEDIPFYYAACDVFVFPSVSSIECMGMTMKEAMACGKPIVGYNVGGVKEAIINGNTGFLIEPNYSILAEKVIKLLKEEELRSKFGKAAFERANYLFKKERTAYKFLKIYWNVLKRYYFS
ncbi:MAG: glycosyltransferase family 4 protein [Candidatus Helarchaeota archaeon]